jgi:hypothetical protein
MVDHFPDDFARFIRDYRCAVHVNPNLRAALLEAAIAQVCNLRSGRWRAAQTPRLFTVDS